VKLPWLWLFSAAKHCMDGYVVGRDSTNGLSCINASLNYESYLGRTLQQVRQEAGVYAAHPSE